MIKPLEEYSPEDRAFVEYVQKLRSQPPQPRRDPGPIDWDEVNALLARQPPIEEHFGFPFGWRYKE